MGLKTKVLGTVRKPPITGKIKWIDYGVIGTTHLIRHRLDKNVVILHIEPGECAYRIYFDTIKESLRFIKKNVHGVECMRRYKRPKGLY